MESRIPKNEMVNQNGQHPLQVLNNSSQQSMPSQKDEDKMPLFLIKLWNIVEDPAYQNIIRWDESGYSFHIIDPYAFCRNVLPHYFKHNNLNSLIRQLNMYGFRKVSPLDKGGLTRSESDQDHLEFSHTSFIRGRPDLMVNIKRRQSNRGADNNVVTAQTQGNLSVVMDELRQLREKQRNMDSKMHEITKENEALWEQLDHVRQQHNRQQQVVNKLVQFLVAIVQPNMSKRVLKRGVLAIDEPPIKRPRSSNSQNSNNNIVDMLDRLQREIVEGGGLQQQKGYQNDRGPIIADVTDELYTNSPPFRSNEPHIASPGSSNLQGSYNNGTTPVNQQKPGYSSGVQYPQQPDVAPNKIMFNQPAPTNQIVSNPNYTSTFTMSPGYDRQISQELQEYLHGMDNGIDNCRDLLNGNWDFGLFENLDDDSNHAPSTSLPNNQLALEQAPAVHTLDFLGGATPATPQHDMLGQQLDIPFSFQNPDSTCATPTLLTPCTSPTYQ